MAVTPNPALPACSGLSPSQNPNSWGTSPFVPAGGPEDLPPRRQHPEELLQVAEEHQREGRLAPPAPRRGRAAHQVSRAAAGAAKTPLQQLGQAGETCLGCPCACLDTQDVL